MSRRLIFYYQTFSGLEPILRPDPIVTHIHLSSIHFGYDQNAQPYIHLNDLVPNSPQYDELWNQIMEAWRLGIKIVLMIGGAGGAFKNLFSDFDRFYNLLTATITEHPYISGICLNIEENVEIENVIMLIQHLRRDYPFFEISMAPVQQALETDQPGLGGFYYKDLMRSAVGPEISYLNAQCYSSFTVESYQKIINNGYPASQIVMGLLSSAAPRDYLYTINTLSRLHNDFGGVFAWEYFDAKPDPATWSSDVNKAMSSRGTLSQIFNFFMPH